MTSNAIFDSQIYRQNKNCQSDSCWKHFQVGCVQYSVRTSLKVIFLLYKGVCYQLICDWSTHWRNQGKLKEWGVVSACSRGLCKWSWNHVFIGTSPRLHTERAFEHDSV